MYFTGFVQIVKDFVQFLQNSYRKLIFLHNKACPPTKKAIESLYARSSYKKVTMPYTIIYHQKLDYFAVTVTRTLTWEHFKTWRKIFSKKSKGTVATAF